VSRLIKSGLVSLALLLLAAAPAAAQTEIAGGFTSLTWNGCCAKGFAADVNFNVRGEQRDASALAVVVDFGVNRWPQHEWDTFVTGGLRWKMARRGRLMVFAQAEAGFAKWNEDAGFHGSGLLVGGGAGVDIRIDDASSVKGQFDVWSYPTDSDILTRLYFAYVRRLGK